MLEGAPYFMFDLDSCGSLYRKVYTQEYIEIHEIDKVLETDEAG